MKQLIELSKLEREDSTSILNRIYESHPDDLHYLAFYDGIYGYSPLGAYLDDKGITKYGDKIMKRLMRDHSPVSLYPFDNVTIYPFVSSENNCIEIDPKAIKRNFKIILNYEDLDYECPYMFVDFGAKITNVNKEVIIEELKNLLKKSKFLKTIIIH